MSPIFRRDFTGALLASLLSSCAPKTRKSLGTRADSMPRDAGSQSYSSRFAAGPSLGFETQPMPMTGRQTGGTGGVTGRGNGGRGGVTGRDGGSSHVTTSNHDGGTPSVQNESTGDWYVSNYGSDAMDGRSPMRPFQTFAKLIAEYDGTGAIYLDRGSRFREELTDLFSTDSDEPVAIRAFGTGARPIIDAREIASASDFTKTGGRTYVYQIAWTHGFDEDGGKSVHRAWENGVMLTPVSSVASCDATAGSYYAATPTNGGPDTIYIHPSGNTDARSDGKEYSFSKRRWAIQLYDAQNQANVYELETIGNSHADGSLVVDGRADNCIARDGRIHNAFIRGLAVDCQAIGMDQSQDYAQFVTYQNAGGASVDGRNTVYRRCYASPGTTSSIGSGFYVHTDGLTQFGTIQYEDCESVGNPTSYGGIQADSMVYYRCRYSNTIIAYTGVGNKRTVILGGTGSSAAAGFVSTYAMNFVGPATFALIVHGMKHYQPDAGLGPIILDAPNCVATVRRCTWASAITNVPQLQRGNITFESNIVYGASGVSGNVNLTIGKTGSVPASFVADGNAYYRVGGANAWTNANTSASYSTIANWRTALSGLGYGTQEATSIEDVDPQLADPAGGDFTRGNATVISLGAGAEQDEEDDAALQALWNLYKVS